MKRSKIILSAKQVADYLFVKGQLCPFCGSEWLDPGKAALDGNEALVPVQCCRCRENWKDVYRLVDIVIP